MEDVKPRRKFTINNNCVDQVRLGATGGYVKALEDPSMETCPEGSVLDEAVRAMVLLTVQAACAVETREHIHTKQMGKNKTRRRFSIAVAFRLTFSVTSLCITSCVGKTG